METSPSGKKINFPMLSDRAQKVSKAYGILNEEKGSTYRSTFIFNPEGQIMAISVYPQPVGRNVDEIIRIIQALQYTESTGLAAPAGWKPGDIGIKRDWDMVGKY